MEAKHFKIILLAGILAAFVEGAESNNGAERSGKFLFGQNTARQDNTAGAAAALAAAAAAAGVAGYVAFDQHRNVESEIDSLNLAVENNFDRSQASLNLFQNQVQGLSPVDGQFGPWSAINECSKSCGMGTFIEVRECNNPAPDFGGQDCLGPFWREVPCNTAPCPIDGGWTDFEGDGSCSVTCGQGVSLETRTCTNPAPAFGGKPCEGAPTKMVSCDTEVECPCPIMFDRDCNSPIFESCPGDNIGLAECQAICQERFSPSPDGKWEYATVEELPYYSQCCCQWGCPRYSSDSDDHIIDLRKC